MPPVADIDSRSGARYADADILEWAGRVHAPHDDALQRAYDAPGREGLPAIQVGPSEGKTLALLLRLASAHKVVEIGTLAGYSGLWIARAIGPEGHLWTFEADAQHAQVARETFEFAGVADRVSVIEGEALSMLSTVERHGPFDAVFVDADKKSYDRYGEWAAAHLRPGGLLIGDNAYLFGKLLGEGEEAQAMRRFHERAARSFDSVCVPTPDGLLVGLRNEIA